MLQVTSKSLADGAYESLMEAIVSGELAPGQRLRIDDLAGVLGTSRVPVRDAIKRLEADGLIETKSNAWTRVTPIRAQEAADAFPIIASLHALATRLGVPALTDDHLERMLEADARRTAALESGQVVEAIEADDSFHGILLEASRNEVLGESIERLMPRIRRLDLLHFSRLSRRNSSGDHAEIIEACRNRDAFAASALVERNFLRLGDEMTALLDEVEAE